MRISLLMEREPFAEILCVTLSSFLPAITGREQRVEWKAHRPGLRWLSGRLARGGGQPWICNFLLNSIWQPGAPAGVLDPVVREYSVSPSVWKTPLQRAYVAMASAPTSAPLFAHAWLSIAPGIPTADDWVILGGNHKLRILQQADGVCYSVLKSGFVGEFMQREIEHRRLAEAAGVPTPPLVDAAEDSGWLLEGYVSGAPLNRLPARRARETLEQVAAALARFSRGTAAAADPTTHAAELVARATESLRGALMIRDPLRAQVAYCLRVVPELLAADAAPMDLAVSHGDFQPANILRDAAGRPWLIDWEYSSRRQLAYDPLVLQLRTRFADGLAGRLRRFVADGATDHPGVETHWLADRWSGVASRRGVALLLCLEELELKLAEHRNPAFARPQFGFAELVAEITGFVRELPR